MTPSNDEFILSEDCADDEIDVFKIMKKVLIHDIVEIDAGDTFLHDEKGYLDKMREKVKRLKGFLVYFQQIKT